VDAGLDAVRLDSLIGRLSEADSGDAEAILDEGAWSHGWPLREGTRWLFVTRWDDAGGDVSLVGDFDEWAPGADPATRVAEDFYYVVVEIEDGRGLKYKWHAGDEFRAPPEATRYGFDEFGEHGWVDAPRGRGWLERFPSMTSGHLELPRTLRVRVPADFEPSAARVLLLHDGQNVFGPEGPFGGWRVDETLDADFPDVLAVAVDNAADRFDAYTHVRDEVLGAERGGRADEYLDLLEEVALPFVRERYGVAAEGDGLVMAGSSLGGLVTLYAAMTRPGLSGCVVAMSSTLGWGAFGADVDGSDALVRRWSEVGPRIYLDSGGAGTCGDPDGDGVDEDSEDSDNYCTTLQLRDHLDALGYSTDEDLFHWWEPGAPHNEAAWRARVSRGLAACDGAWVPR